MFTTAVCTHLVGYILCGRDEGSLGTQGNERVLCATKESSAVWAMVEELIL